ncbi:MAG: photosynthetic complex putative assembly protein PuhB [Rhodospirillaceae bacterium]|nr:photosynthetic complex putative assembly protein PuhB [Rhodospirillaceae bacterium]
MGRGHDDYDTEPIRGLPALPPDGEHILWQGAPDWKVLALSAFHVGTVAAYFAALMVWRGAISYTPEGGVLSAAVSALSLVPFAVAAIAVLAGLAWLSSRTSVYTITTRRVVFRIGIALPAAINIPFRAIDSAALRPRLAGTGDIPLTLKGPERVGYVNFWPHVRPWRLARPEPMLRAVPKAREVATLLAQALRRASLETAAKESAAQEAAAGAETDKPHGQVPAAMAASAAA